jgi:hypothetical protein
MGTLLSVMKKWARELTVKKGWSEVLDGLEVKTCEGPDGDETFLLCRSADFERKERAIHERFTRRVRTDIGKLGRRLKRARENLSRGDV